jgi:hypothetical protein
MSGHTGLLAVRAKPGESMAQKVSGPRHSSDTFLSVESIPPIQPQIKLPGILGNGALIKFTSDGGDVDKVFAFFSEEIRKSPDDASLLLDLALLHLIGQRKEEAYRAQAEALARQQLFRVVGTKGRETATRRRVLALVAPGDFMNNAQLEFILDGSDIGLDVLYLVPGQPLPSVLPQHDVAFCAVNESNENLPVLNRLSQLLPAWPRPVLNPPEKIKGLTRDSIASLFARSANICAPQASRVAVPDLRRLARQEVPLDDLLPQASFPILARPVGSHCGKKLEKIDGPGELTHYLEGLENEDEEFYLASFMDYRGADGLFHKYRIVLIEGVPFLCHLALSEQWMIHYVNVGMTESASKRAEEARAMETFEHDFARRHGAAFAELGERLGLDYFGIDCSELPDGRLLLFEAETAMVIHAMDSPALYPYKQGQMARVFAAFRAMIDRAALRAPGIAGK